jgi:hypothetical protein
MLRLFIAEGMKEKVSSSEWQKSIKTLYLPCLKYNCQSLYLNCDFVLLNSLSLGINRLTFTPHPTTTEIEHPQLCRICWNFHILQIIQKDG